MTDRELLELAAKAAGIDWDAQMDNGTIVIAAEAPEFWDPLTDDGDALRLAVKLGLLVDCDSVVLQGCQVEAVSGMSSHEDNYVHILEKYGNDPYAATRRAIVRAAAEIGRKKK